MTRSSFFFRWLAANTAGLALGLMLAYGGLLFIGLTLRAAESAMGALGGAAVGGLFFGTLFGAALGLVQAFLIIPLGISAWRWVGNSAAASGLGLLVGFPLLFLLSPSGTAGPILFAGAGVALGLALGVMQGWMLRARGGGVLLWTAVMLLAMISSLTVAALLLPFSPLLALLLGGLLNSAVSGAGAVALLFGRPADKDKA